LREGLGLLDVPSGKRARVEGQFSGCLRAAAARDVTYPVTLDTAAADAWVRMGPHAWHVSPDQPPGTLGAGPVEALVACTVLAFVK